MFPSYYCSGIENIKKVSLSDRRISAASLFWEKKQFFLGQKKIGNMKNSSEGQQQAFGKALYISCIRYVEEENEK